MDFISWLEQNNISFSISKGENGYLFSLNNVSATNGILKIDTPCIFGRTARNSLNLFLISYNGFFLSKGKTNLFIDQDVLEVKTIPPIS